MTVVWWERALDAWPEDEPIDDGWWDSLADADAREEAENGDASCRVS